LHDFRGKLAHSAAWDETIDTSGKKVAVIGTGSSSIQMVPSLAKGQLCVIVILRKTKSKPTGAEHLTIFMRNQVWISPQIPTDAQKLETSDRKAIIGRHYYTEEEKQSFRNDSYFHLAYRKELEAKMGKKFPVFLRGTPDNLVAKKIFRADMMRKLGPGREKLLETMIPDWSPGCRRMTVSICIPPMKQHCV
jgi:cation diffusion facilitator CzcD-associated flavoprotein CzcO